MKQNNKKNIIKKKKKKKNNQKVTERPSSMLQELKGSLKLTILFGELEEESIFQCKIISENVLLAKTTTAKPSKCPLWRESFVLNISNQSNLEIHIVDKLKV